MTLNRTGKSIFWFSLTLLGLIALAWLGPSERTLGSNVRVVYLHGAWVWAALAGFTAAGLLGVLGLARRSERLQRWSRALGRSGLFFWVTYMPISMWAMQTNWNGLFLSEPRFRVAVIFSVVGLLLQLGFTLLEKPGWAAAGNAIYAAVLWVTLRLTPNVMHPPSPIWSSDAVRIQAFFGSLTLLTLALVWQTALWFYLAEIRNATHVRASADAGLIRR